MRESIHKNFDNFLRDPKIDKLFKFLTENFGEIGYKYDFKKDWQDCQKIAKHILGFSNSGGGGIIIGVEQNKDNTFNKKGLDSIADHNKVDQHLRKYIPDGIYEILDFQFDDIYKELAGKKFQVIIIKDLPGQIPFVTSFDGGKDIKKGTVYIRRPGGTEPTTYEELQDIIKRRIENECYFKEFVTLNKDYSIKEANSRPLLIKKDSLADFGDYSAKLLSFDKVAVVRLYIGGRCIKCIKFGSGGPYRFENYYLYAESLSADKIEGRLGEISTI